MPVKLRTASSTLESTTSWNVAWNVVPGEKGGDGECGGGEPGSREAGPPTHPLTGHTLHKQPQSAAGNAGMWHTAEDLLGVPRGSCSGPQSFFVGDAAGRDGDHGDDDRRLALSAGVQFWSETDFFRDDPLQLLK